MQPCRTVVLADLHLVRETPRGVIDDLARFVAAHPGVRIIFAGDLFDLSSESPFMPHSKALNEVLLAHAQLRSAFSHHVERGGELWFASGNHDAEVGYPAFVDGFMDVLGVPPKARSRIRTTPWFFREGAIHIEHGHLYDPDNAPAHPLVAGERSLGVHFVEEFIAPTGAYRYLHANDQTPLNLLLAAFRWYGSRAPYVIYRYFYAAIGAVLKSGPFYRAQHELALGNSLTERFAADLGIPPELPHEVITLAATPTLTSLPKTLTRLYFDRVLGSLSLSGGLIAMGLGKYAPGAITTAFGGLALGLSWATGHNRYAGLVTERLRSSALLIAEATHAKLVIFGHSHCETLDGPYANSGSFAFPRNNLGRPYLELEGTCDRPRAVHRYFT